MFKKIEDKGNQQIMKFKKSFYNIQNQQQILNIFKSNIELCSQESKQQMALILQPKIINKQVVQNDGDVILSQEQKEQFYSNLLFYNSYLQNYNQLDNFYYNMQYFKGNIIIFQDEISKLMYLKYISINNSQIQSSPAAYISFNKTLKNNNEMKYLKLNIIYKSILNHSLDIIINNQYINQAKYYKLQQSNEYINKEIIINLDQVFTNNEQIKELIIILKIKNNYRTQKNNEHVLFFKDIRTELIQKNIENEGEQYLINIVQQEYIL